MRRVNEAVREVLSEAVGELKDPRIGFVTVTGVEVSPDLRHAWVYYTVLGDERQRKATAAGLRSATAHLRQAIGREVRLKTLPELEFRQDETEEQGRRIEEIIERLHEGEDHDDD